MGERAFFVRRWGHHRRPDARVLSPSDAEDLLRPPTMNEETPSARTRARTYNSPRRDADPAARVSHPRRRCVWRRSRRSPLSMDARTIRTPREALGAVRPIGGEGSDARHVSVFVCCARSLCRYEEPSLTRASRPVGAYTAEAPRAPPARAPRPRDVRSPRSRHVGKTHLVVPASSRSRSKSRT